MAEMVRLEGNTFPVKDGLKALGCKWDGDTKAWKCPADKLDEANAIIKKGPTAPPQERKPFVHYKCKACGVKASRYQKIRRDGYCWDCASDE